MNPITKLTTHIKTRTEVKRDWLISFWLPGLYHGNTWFGDIDSAAYFTKYRMVLEAILARPKTYINAAVLQEDPDCIVSFAVLEDTPTGTLLHWVYTRPKWRKLGLAKELLPPNVTTVTHLTKVGRAIKPKEWKFDPFL